jgi:hypothetical protein
MNIRGRAAGALFLAPVLTVSAAAAADLPLHAIKLPPDVQGRWAYEAGDCHVVTDGPDNDGVLTIEGRTILFFASGYDITRLVRQRDGSLRALGLRSDEGETGRSRGAVTLKLIAPDRFYVVSDGHVYQRCPNPPR